MIIETLSTFPDMYESVMGASMMRIAQEKGILDFKAHDLRDWTHDRHRTTDDDPYGGGQGLVMKCEPIFEAYDDIVAQGSAPYTIFLTPCGEPFDQGVATELSEKDRLLFICGHYEGIDERFIEECVDEEISMGDFVLTGGEIPAMALADAVCRLVPGVLPDAECYEEESHWDGLLEYPQYSRPENWHGRHVPAILLSGNHQKVAEWRKKESYKRTLRRRPDMMVSFDPSVLDKKGRIIYAAALEELQQEDGAASD